MQESRERILSALSEGPVTGPELADDLEISRAAVWKHIEELRDAGFEITSTGSGYEIESVPEFGGIAVEFGLDAPFEIEYHDSIGSTNARARGLATEGRENVVVLADEQTGGRGRLDREWSSPSGGLWLSILLRPTRPATHAPVYTLAAAVATARAVRETGVDARIKWPNDVLVEGRKLSGILTEMEGEADRISWLVVGIGINANVGTDYLPDREDVTSLQAEVGEVDRRSLTQTLITEFHELVHDEGEIVPAWRDLSATLDRRVRVETADGTVEGRAIDVEFPGSLVIETDGEETVVTVGDCTHLRASEGA
jgi:BirA family biotin operon repressor/biotin-[acetyl-CoA-carboxylase] ligase